MAAFRITYFHQSICFIKKKNILRDAVCNALKYTNNNDKKDEIRKDECIL